MKSKESLYLTDGQIADKIGVPPEDFKDIAPTLERSGFPTKDSLFNDKRYWPAIQAFLDKRNGLASSFTRRNPTPEKKGVEVW